MIDLRGFRGWAELNDQPFLRRVGGGDVSEGAFKRWLRQEQHLFEAMLGLQTSLLRRAPPRHRLVKANALLVTVEELDWLENLDLPPEPVHPVRQGYIDFLNGLESKSYAVGTLAHWARHRAFFDAWNSLQPNDPDDDDSDGMSGLPDEVTLHWMAPEAQALIHDFGSLALEVSADLSPAESNRVVKQVLELEQASWEMALEFALSDLN